MKMRKFESPHEPVYSLDLSNENVQSCIKGLADNPKTWQRIENKALKMAETHKRISVRYIVDWLRYEYYTEVPNVYCSIISRLLTIMKPEELKGKFVQAKSDHDTLALSGREEGMEEYNGQIRWAFKQSLLLGYKPMEKNFIKLAYIVQ